MTQPKARTNQPTRHPYALPTDLARELIALLCDDEGDSDEDLLDLARKHFDQPSRITADVKQRRNKGLLVVFDLTNKDVELVRQAIDDWETPAARTKRLGSILRMRLPENRGAKRHPQDGLHVRA